MSEDQKSVNIKVGSGDGSGWFWLAIVLLALSFCGEPDLHDAAVSHLMAKPAAVKP